jgi:L-threonylcarbamoyladenylate synthase
MPGASERDTGAHRATAPRRIPAALIRALRRHLRSGGAIAYATESCFGLGCDPRDPRGVARVLALKGRQRAKGLILIASDPRQLRPYLAPVSADAQARLDAAWPGPVTFLVPASRVAPPWIVGRHRRVAVRVTAHPDAVALCAALNMALVSTSANRAGARPARTYSECLRRFGNGARVVPGRVGRRRRPSTIIDLETGRILRA